MLLSSERARRAVLIFALASGAPGLGCSGELGNGEDEGAGSTNSTLENPLGVVGSGGAILGAGGASSSGGALNSGSGGVATGGTSQTGTGGAVTGGSSGVGGSVVVGTRAACKRGIAYGGHSQADFNAVSPRIAWGYNWSSRPEQALRNGSYPAAEVSYVPMVWGGQFNADDLIEQIPTEADTLLGFNEPNFHVQANLSAGAAAALWPQLEAIADARGLDLISPAVNYCGGGCQDTDPYRYLDDFLAACSGCRIDGIAIHIYVGCNQDGANKAQWLINQVETYKEKYSQPLWLTEFACTDAANFSEQEAFMKDALAYLENEPQVVRYAWFSGRFEGIPFLNLLGGDGQLTTLGVAYAAAPAHSSCGF